MTEFTRHTLDTAPEASKPLLEDAKKSMGFIPNLYTVMAEAPSLLEAYKAVGTLFQNSSFNNDEHCYSLAKGSTLLKDQPCVQHPHRPHCYLANH